MADQNVIKEFLVGLGFKVDEKGLKSFADGVGDATAKVKGLVTAITGAALVIATGVAAFGSTLEQLYFSSKRIGASATNIKTMQNAFKDFGIGAEETTQTLEKMGNFLKFSFAPDVRFEQMGIHVRKANGDLRDTADILVDVAHRVKGMTLPEAKVRTEGLGISDAMLQAMQDKDFDATIARHKKALGSMSLDSAAEKAHKAGIEFRKAQEQFFKSSTKIEEYILAKIIPALNKFNAWWEIHGERLTHRVEEVVGLVWKALVKLKPIIKWLLDKFIELDKSTDGWSTRLAALGAAFVLLGGPAILSALRAVTGAFTSLGGAIAAAGAAYVAWKSGNWIGTKLREMMPQDVQDALGERITNLLAMMGNKEAIETKRLAKKNGLWKMTGGEDDAAEDAAAAKEAKIGKPGRPAPSATHSFSLMNAVEPAVNFIKRLARDARPVAGATAERLMAFFEKKGWTHAQAAGIVANLHSESGFNPKAEGDHGEAYGIAQWHRDRQAAFAKWAGHDIRQSTEREQLEFINYELREGARRKAGQLLKAAKSSYLAGKIVSRHYESPGEDRVTQDREAKSRGAKAAQISQTVHIHVNGAQDPARVARETHSHITNQLTRNLAGGMT